MSRYLVRVTLGEDDVDADTRESFYMACIDAAGLNVQSHEDFDDFMGDARQDGEGGIWLDTDEEWEEAMVSTHMRDIVEAIWEAIGYYMPITIQANVVVDGAVNTWNETDYKNFNSGWSNRLAEPEGA